MVQARVERAVPAGIGGRQGSNHISQGERCSGGRRRRARGRRGGDTVRGGEERAKCGGVEPLTIGVHRGSSSSGIMIDSDSITPDSDAAFTLHKVFYEAWQLSENYLHTARRESPTRPSPALASHAKSPHDLEAHAAIRGGDPRRRRGTARQAAQSSRARCALYADTNTSIDAPHTLCLYTDAPRSHTKPPLPSCYWLTPLHLRDASGATICGARQTNPTTACARAYSAGGAGSAAALGETAAATGRSTRETRNKGPLVVRRGVARRRRARAYGGCERLSFRWYCWDADAPRRRSVWGINAGVGVPVEAGSEAGDDCVVCRAGPRLLRVSPREPRGRGGFSHEMLERGSVARGSGAAGAEPS
ncbi:hypothetical protein B0H17DRAFT_1135468 [Mycena rosella]|uniref:Uncharacterized protein n=1 Tax=Mycena rosella TaxID=1033263 RepID=A0AAD7DDJ6_MYCRO|nr:hypothetical protein B0H17DRAFT_1135468 [Mycena rosella]